MNCFPAVTTIAEFVEAGEDAADALEPVVAGKYPEVFALSIRASTRDGCWLRLICCGQAMATISVSRFICS